MYVCIPNLFLDLDTTILQESNLLKDSSSVKMGLEPKTWVIIGDQSETKLTWHFRSLSNVCITVRLLNDTQHQAFIVNSILNEYISLSNGTKREDEGTFNLPYFDFWHIYFLNLDPINNSTILAFSVIFEEDISSNQQEEIIPNIFIIMSILTTIALISLCLVSIYLFYLLRKRKYM